MNFGRSMFTVSNNTPRFDMLGDAVGAAKVLRGRADLMAGARRDAAQRFADARIAAAKKGLANAQSQASGIRQQGFLNAATSVVSGGLQGAFSEGGIFNRTPTPSPTPDSDMAFNIDSSMPLFGDYSNIETSGVDYSQLFRS